MFLQSLNALQDIKRRISHQVNIDAIADEVEDGEVQSDGHWEKVRQKKEQSFTLLHGDLQQNSPPEVA